MYYLVNIEDVGLNADPSRETFEIRTEPPRTNSSHEIKTEGWCGTTNDIQVLAKGEFDSIEDAEQAMAEIAGEDGYRDYPGDGTDAEDWDNLDAVNGVVRRYWFGELPYLDREASSVFAYETIEERVTAESSDADIDSLVDELDQECRRECNARMHWSTVYGEAQRLRDYLAEKAAD